MSQDVLPPPFPLKWPDDKKRTLQRQKPKYTANSVSSAMRDLSDEMSRSQIRLWELTSNSSVRSSADLLPDPGAALWFLAPQSDSTRERRLMVLACDLFLGLS